MNNRTDIRQPDLQTQQGTPRRVHVETWGCQMNTADSERMLMLLAESRYEFTSNPDDADLILLNTCHIREKARHKVLSRLGVLRDLKDKNPGLRIAVAGCVAQADGQRLIEAAPQIDVLFGPGKIDELPRLIAENARTGKPAVALGFPREGEHDHEAHAEQREQQEMITGTSAAPLHKPTVTGRNEISRYVNIQQGCNNFCTFCVVPHTRGREISRLPAEVYQEVAGLVAAGAREITVLGQNVNSYGTDLVDSGRLAPGPTGPFVGLLERLAEIPDLKRLRFTTSNPHDFTPDLASLFARRPVLGRYIHLAMQSGSDGVLERMRRKVTVAEFMERVGWLRAAVPDMAISTDLIVGFPGETEEQFEETLELVRQVGFSFSFNFKYSPRRHTPAARFQDQVSEQVKEDRLARLIRLQDQLTLEQNLAEIGQVREVLFHYESRKAPGMFYGRTSHFRLLRVPSAVPVTGRMALVRIVDANKTALAGEIVEVMA